MSVYRLKGTSGQVINKAWGLVGVSVIGSDSACEVQVDSEAVAPRHAALEPGKTELRLRLLADGAELVVNGEDVVDIRLASGDEIRIGNCRWMLQAPGLRPEKVLTESAVRRRRPLWPWLLAGAVSALALLAWRLGYVPF